MGEDRVAVLLFYHTLCLIMYQNILPTAHNVNYFIFIQLNFLYTHV